jgi:hypothetical protein
MSSAVLLRSSPSMQSIQFSRKVRPDSRNRARVRLVLQRGQSTPGGWPVPIPQDIGEDGGGPSENRRRTTKRCRCSANRGVSCVHQRRSPIAMIADEPTCSGQQPRAPPPHLPPPRPCGDTATPVRRAADASVRGWTEKHREHGETVGFPLCSLCLCVSNEPSPMRDSAWRTSRVLPAVTCFPLFVSS